MAFVWTRWAPDYVGTDGQGGGWQIPRARCARICFQVSRKGLTPGPLLTSNHGCQHHFLEWPVKINMWTETGGLWSSVRWAKWLRWHVPQQYVIVTLAKFTIISVVSMDFLKVCKSLTVTVISPNQILLLNSHTTTSWGLWGSYLCTCVWRLCCSAAAGTLICFFFWTFTACIMSEALHSCPCKTTIVVQLNYCELKSDIYALTPSCIYSLFEPHYILSFNFTFIIKQCCLCMDHHSYLLENKVLWDPQKEA